MSLIVRLKAAAELLSQNVAPLPYAFYAEKKLNTKLQELRGERCYMTPDKDADLNAVVDDLMRYHTLENDRKKSIDDKAKSALFIITLSSTIMLGGLTLVKGSEISFGVPLLLTISAGVVCFVQSGIASVIALSSRAFYGPNVVDQIKKVDGEYKIKPPTKLDQAYLLYRSLTLMR
jgi:hypothetical protein